MSVFPITMQWEFEKILRINAYLSKQLLPLHTINRSLSIVE